MAFQILRLNLNSEFVVFPSSPNYIFSIVLGKLGKCPLIKMTLLNGKMFPVLLWNIVKSALNNELILKYSNLSV